ncbi:hypothetical protein BN946_scf184920.g29 [Trametes cinnabarina]|uniref:Uncharacterized protein n=1 Tax=Pycnoporus cinnabarinus TaxID=5643 RepID=A0A060SBL9_PYCCI|nr:hypothetical protein BN946_scf184920.g29 [Trametes cinnabarina]
MAVLAPQDWHPPRDHTMDAPSPNAINASLPRQRSSPANDHPLAQPQMPQQQPYPYPVQQQQQAAWSPNVNPQQFYPQFYQNPHQQPYPIHPHSGHPQQGQMPYYDPANAQFAQWAYQQMMLNAQHQAHQMSQMSQAGSQRSRSGNNHSPDYFAQNPMAGFSPFPSGTPPAHPSQLPMGYSPGPPSDQGSQYNGYHPYRRPQRHGSQNQDQDWRNGPQHAAGPFKPPYAHADAAGSSTSVNSSSSQSGSHRQRTNSTQGSVAGTSSSGAAATHSHSKSSSSNGHGRTATSSSTPPATSASNVPVPPRLHQRTGSSSSNASSRTANAAPSTTPPSTSSPAAPHSTVNLRKPSPLSQGTFTAAEKRMSRDDSDLAAMLEPTSGVRSAGLKGRLRRALALNASATVREEDEDDSGRAHPSRPSQSSVGSSATLAMDDGDSTATVQKKKSRSLFNSKLNRSTDNISLSSTMSSASMVIRKLGSIGKLARRNSLAGITSLFKDKKDKEGEEEGSGKKSKKKKGDKASPADPSVSHATAELDRSDWSASPEMAGLSPAARLARQHTLKTNAEAAAKAKAEAEARAAAAAAAAASHTPVPTTWEKNTTNRQGDASPAKPSSSSRVGENGTRVVVEHDNSDSEDDHTDGGHGNHAQNYSIEGWEDDEDWNEAQEDEDVTIRQGLDNASLEDDEDMEPWAINVRRSIERTLKPAKGILKNGADYKQDDYLPPNPAFTRTRSNSYDSAQPTGELPHLGHLPASDPAQIDGLHKQHGSSSNGNSPKTSSSFLPPLSFDSKGLTIESPKHEDSPSSSGTHAEKNAIFSHPNSSAPALSLHTANPPTLTHRSQTAPTKRLAFAANLSVYDTFPATVYDRRSEPATWSRLTPALAQRIKEELNSYKMEEMEVHAASRVHTQFFV